jgi:hypothetical protein
MKKILKNQKGANPGQKKRYSGVIKRAKILREQEKKKEIEGVEFQVSQMTFSGGMTLNMGDYESFRADVSITLKNNKEFSTTKEKKESIARMQIEGWDLVDEVIRPKLVSAKAVSKKRSGV